VLGQPSGHGWSADGRAGDAGPVQDLQERPADPAVREEKITDKTVLTARHRRPQDARQGRKKERSGGPHNRGSVLFSPVR
jgi:hypothetical protein